MFLLKFLFKCCLGKGGSALGCAPEIVVAQFRQVVVVVVRLESDRALFGAHQGPPELNRAHQAYQVLISMEREEDGRMYNLHHQ